MRNSALAKRRPVRAGPAAAGLIGVVFATVPVFGSPFSCKSGPSELISSAEQVVRAKILTLAPGPDVPCRTSQETGGGPRQFAFCGSTHRLSIQVLEYLRGNGPDRIDVEFETCMLFEYPDRFPLTPGTEAIFFIERNDGRLRVVQGEGGILDMENLANARTAVRLRDLKLTLSLDPPDVETGRTIRITHELRNVGRDRFRGCIGAENTWTFVDAMTQHIVRLHSVVGLKPPKCAVVLDIEPETSFEWTREVGVPVGVEHGWVQAVAELQLLSDPECQSYLCGQATLKSLPTPFRSIPERR